MSSSFVKLPYYAPRASIPGKLPTIREIERSTAFLAGHQIHQKVVRVGAHFVVKYGLDVSLEEGQTMMYVGEVVKLPVPKVYALFQGPFQRINYIIMQYVPGVPLDRLWWYLSPSQKLNIADDIKEYIKKLRVRSSPKGYCSIGGQPLRHDLFRIRTGPDSWLVKGPFTTEHELNNVIFEKCFGGPGRQYRKLFFGSHASSVLHSHPPTFTHGDLQGKNILVQTAADGTYQITFLDWALAGWYPSYWEYVGVIRGCDRFPDDWIHMVEQILQPYPQEWIWFSKLMEALR